MPDEIAFLDATAQAELVRRRELTPRELVDAAIARFERVNPQLNAVTLPALEQARERAGGELPRGPFAGVPFLMKDLGGLEAGRRYTGGMRCLKDANWTERANAYITDKFLAAGLVILGRPTRRSSACCRPPSRKRTAPPTIRGTSHTAPAARAAARRRRWRRASCRWRTPATAAARSASPPRTAARRAQANARPQFVRSRCRRELERISAELVVTRTVRDTAAMLDVTTGPMPGDPYAPRRRRSRIARRSRRRRAACASV